MIILSILGKFHVKPRKNASCLYFQLTRNVHFKWNIWNFKLNFLSRGQLESLNLDRIFLPLIQNITMLWGFFGNLILAIIARMLCGNHLNCSVVSTYYDSYLIFAFFGGTMYKVDSSPPHMNGYLKDETEELGPSPYTRAYPATYPAPAPPPSGTPRRTRTLSTPRKGVRLQRVWQEILYLWKTELDFHTKSRRTLGFE